MCASADATYLFMKMHAFLSFSCNFEMVKIKEKKGACSNPFHEKAGGNSPVKTYTSFILGQST